jgi:antitoxin component HigA of HigAB toxin-antitoxin module
MSNAAIKNTEKQVLTPSQYHAAMSRIEDFLARGFENLNAKEANLLDDLSDQVHEYEALKYPMPMASSVSGILQGYMTTHNLNRTKLGKVLQVSGSTISDILNGKKGISFPLAVKMYKILNINAEELLSVKIDSSSPARQDGIFQGKRVSSGRIKVSSKRRSAIQNSAAKKAARRK